jgi:hypothetical protein
MGKIRKAVRKNRTFVHGDTGLVLFPEDVVDACMHACTGNVLVGDTLSN